MQLIVRLLLRLAGVVLLCLSLAIGWVMLDAHRMIRAETAASAERVAHELENLFWREILWRGSMRRDKILPIPNWESLATLKLVSPGVCIMFAPGAETPRELCSQTEGVGAPEPQWFARLFDFLFGPPAPIERALTVRQPETGVVIARADPEAAVRQAWREISIVAGVAVFMAIGVSLLAALVIIHALAPTRVVIDGLRRLESGNYRHRIHTFTCGEFGLIARAVNDLAERLAQTTAERVALTKRLFEVQEEERRALARDLHDEFGQCLTATTAFAAAIEAGAQDRPDLAADARSIGKAARRMTATLREALARLRSQDLDELGLEACLVQLVAGWNAQTAPRAVVHLDLMGDLAAVPPSVSTSVFRIAQECLTNAMRHGRPHDVYLRVERLASNDGVVALTVEDDGGGDPTRIDVSAGHGLLGMRERVSAFGGSLEIGRAARGVCVAARIPLVAANANAAMGRKAA
ncbi:sensor histidine kinase [Methylosinus sp. Sm6]|uniref:sensor histidine kinase n=1 Tax=Methylosinus sp. Sm6 TaxID=2866948 RepID=UPI001C996353|nr:histidine kinase [Methylosinus sp. Sm6]MBY6243294.1 HAMP domain-containing protein [Methylosinus sp. Sm6]